jgi:hypothetical protein
LPYRSGPNKPVARASGDLRDCRFGFQTTAMINGENARKFVRKHKKT